MSSRRPRINAAKSINDIEPGDFVRRYGHTGVGLVETVENGWAWVAWKGERKDYLPLPALRRVSTGGETLDSRRWS